VSFLFVAQCLIWVVIAPESGCLSVCSGGGVDLFLVCGSAVCVFCLCGGIFAEVAGRSAVVLYGVLGSLMFEGLVLV